MEVWEQLAALEQRGFTEGQSMRYQRWDPTPPDGGDQLQQVFLYSGFANDSPQWVACSPTWKSPTFDSPLAAFAHAEVENWGRG